jgi:hypothetical protein
LDFHGSTFGWCCDCQLTPHIATGTPIPGANNIVMAPGLCFYGNIYRGKAGKQVKHPVRILVVDDELSRKEDHANGEIVHSAEQPNKKMTGRFD